MDFHQLKPNALARLRCCKAGVASWKFPRPQAAQGIFVVSILLASFTQISSQSVSSPPPAIQSAGTPQGSATTLNFTGAISASVSGGVATITAPTGGAGATGPTGPAPSGTGLVVVNSSVPSAATASGDVTFNPATGAFTVVSLSGNPFAAIATGGRWDQLLSGTAALSLSNTTFGTAWNNTSAAVYSWINTTASTSSVAQPSPLHKLCGYGWTTGGSAVSTQACSTIQQTFGAVAAPQLQFVGPTSFICCGASSVTFTNYSSVTNATGGFFASSGISANQNVGFNSSNMGIQTSGGASNVWQLIDTNSGRTYSDLALVHVIGSSAPPTGAAGTGAGTSPTINLPTGNDMFFGVSLTTGTAPTLSGVIETLTFATGFTNVAGTAKAPHCVLFPTNAATALLSGVSMVFTTPTATTLTITAGTTALTGATAYAWDGVCGGTNQ